MPTPALMPPLEVQTATNEKKRDNAQASDNGHVVIGVRIVQGYHATMANSEFSTFGPNYQLVVRLYELIVTFPCSHFLHTFAPRKHVI